MKAIKRRRVERDCLRCRRSFKSSGIGNRLCPKCNEHNGTLSYREEYCHRIRSDVIALADTQ